MQEIKPLSYSEMNLFRTDKEEWHRRYILDERDEQTLAQELGSLIHRRMENRGFDVAQGLRGLMMPPSHRAMVEKLVLRAEKLPRTGKAELKVEAVLPTGDKLFGIFDRFDEEKRFLTEYKTGDTDRWWSQNVVDNNEQLSFYAFMYYLNTGLFLRNIALYALNTKNATIKAYSTVRGPADLKLIAEKIGDTIAEMKSLGLWDSRKRSILRVATLEKIRDVT